MGHYGLHDEGGVIFLSLHRLDGRRGDGMVR